MLTWHNVWMARHGSELAGELRAAGQAVVDGSKSLLALAVVVGVAVLREGSEVVLFLYGVHRGRRHRLGRGARRLCRAGARRARLPADLFRPGADPDARAVRDHDRV